MSVRDQLPANGLRKGKEINNFDPGGEGGNENIWPKKI
jgi:hypothetical protein